MNTSLTKTLETARLVLREFTNMDLDQIHSVMGDPQVMRFSLSGPYSREKTEQFLKGCMEAYTKRGIGLFAVVHRMDKLVIGYCGFYFPVIDGVEEIEIGYRINPTYWNQGLATEACQALKDFGFNSLGFHRLISCIEKDNIASIRVAEKNGMHHEKDALFAEKIPVRIYSISTDKEAQQGAAANPYPLRS